MRKKNSLVREKDKGGWGIKEGGIKESYVLDECGRSYFFVSFYFRRDVARGEESEKNASRNETEKVRKQEKWNR